jgi:DNA polymerase-4
VKDRVILHSDLNSFYASVEIMRNPALRGKPVAVCGDSSRRCGIVLAKSQEAKMAGVRTAMANWEALRLCPQLIMVPPDFAQYKKYSRLTRLIYQRYTDQVEPFGMDECWLDVTHSVGLFGSGEQIAQQIRKTVREELGLTVSIGVSFNKVFAKLGSDMKKPDAVTVITPQNFRDKVWPLPAEALLFVGAATKRTLSRLAIHSIGDLAHCDPDFLVQSLGKSGRTLWLFANGLDASEVLTDQEIAPLQSIGHGMTYPAPLEQESQVAQQLFCLAQDIGRRLRKHKLCACGVQLAVKDEEFHIMQCQSRLHQPTQHARTLFDAGMTLFQSRYLWREPIRALTLRAIELIDETEPVQQSLFDACSTKSLRMLDATIDGICRRFGPDSLKPASMLDDKRYSDEKRRLN